VNRKISNLIKGFINILIFLCMLSMILLVASQVVFRYVLKWSVPWTEEIARVFFVWIIFIGVALVEEEDGQISVDMFIQKLPPGIYRIWKSIILILESTFVAILFVGSIKSLKTVSLINLGTVPHLDYRILYIPVLIAAPCIIWFLLNRLLALYKFQHNKEVAK
jgi:TRAP-type C4-dicarboxylate transport system permease small subunit